MRNRKSNLFMLFVLVLLSVVTVSRVEAHGLAEIQLLNYSNPRGLVHLGKACDSFMGSTVATSECDHSFEICVSSSEARRCDLANIPRKHVFTDSNVITFSQFQAQIHNVSVKFTGSLENVYVRILVYDVDSSAIEVTSDFQRTIAGVKPNFDWTPLQVTDRGTEMWFGVRARCNPSYFGDTCTKYCRNSSDDRTGHYVCDSSGNKQCLLDWTGSECTERITTALVSSSSESTATTRYSSSSLALSSGSLKSNNASTASPYSTNNTATQHPSGQEASFSNTTHGSNGSLSSGKDLARFASARLSDALAVLKNPWIISALAVVLVLAFSVSVTLAVLATRANKRKQRVRESSQCVLLRPDSQTNGNQPEQTDDSTYAYAYSTPYVSESAPGNRNTPRASYKRMADGLMALFSRTSPIQRSTERNALDNSVARATLISNVYTSAGDEYSNADMNRASRDLDNLYSDPEDALTVETVRLTNKKPPEAANNGVTRLDGVYSTPILQLQTEEEATTQAAQQAQAHYSVPICNDPHYSVPVPTDSNYCVQATVEPNYSVPINGLYSTPVS